MTRRILVTGATGFIGRQIVLALAQTGVDVTAVVRTMPADGAFSASVNVVQFDLLSADETKRSIAAARADILIHCAWDVSPGYWTSGSNHAWLAASKALIDAFSEYGGRRIILAGTCAEYDWQGAGDLLNEHRSGYRPATPYGQAKLALRQYAEAWCARGDRRSFASGLIFFPFGPGEQVGRLVPSVIQSCLRNEAPKVSSGTQIRDFIDSWSVGEALAALAASNVIGPVNIGSGVGRSIGDVVTMIRDRINPNLEIEFGAIPDRPDDPVSLVADLRRLREEVEYIQEMSLVDTLDRTIGYWRAQMET